MDIQASGRLLTMFGMSTCLKSDRSGAGGMRVQVGCVEGI